MRKSLVTMVAMLAILSLGSLASEPARAGNGAQGTPLKSSSQTHRYTTSSITEFSSSSAPVTHGGPKK
jgi:hypothetical protein